MYAVLISSADLGQNTVQPITHPVVIESHMLSNCLAWQRLRKHWYSGQQ